MEWKDVYVPFSTYVLQQKRHVLSTMYAKSYMVSFSLYHVLIIHSLKAHLNLEKNYISALEVWTYMQNIQCLVSGMSWETASLCTSFWLESRLSIHKELSKNESVHHKLCKKQGATLHRRMVKSISKFWFVMPRTDLKLVIL